MRQGDPICPKVFSAAVQDFSKIAKLEEKGIDKEEEKLVDLRYVGDAALITEGVKDMEHQLNTVIEKSLTTGLMIYKEKPNL